MPKNYRLILLFNANKAYDRQVIEGIGNYLDKYHCDWDLLMEEDFTYCAKQLDSMVCDGIIADMDDDNIRTLVSQVDVPIVGVGSSFNDPNDYPEVPYVATDNQDLLKSAFNHLKDKGIENFAFYGLANNCDKPWAKERELAFKQVVDKLGYKKNIIQGIESSVINWQYDMNRLADWLQSLPIPTGIIAVTDSRARHLIQACEQNNILVPEQIAIVGIDNEEVVRFLTKIPLSSVEQGCLEMGYQAAKLMHESLLQPELLKKRTSLPRIVVPANKVHERQSSEYVSLNDPFVIQAMHFIKRNACKGIKVEQVLDHIGISRSNLDTRFREERGHSIHHEIHQEKLKYACELLCDINIPIQSVADRSGYPSLQYMYSVFKKDLGYTPKEFRVKKSCC